MKIREILRQHRRDFTAIYECQHCNQTRESSGYDDAYFHQEVIPNMICTECGKAAPDNYVPLATKYPERKQV